MSLFSPLLIVCLDPEKAATAAELATSLGYPDAHLVVGGFKQAEEALTLRTTSPEYIIVDIGDHVHGVLTDIDHFALSCEPNVRVVIIGDVNDIVFYRELKQRGVLEYFNHPVQASDVHAVLMKSVSHYTPATDAPKGTVISLMSAASGDGASTLAINLAYCLAEEYKQRTVLVDLGYQFGLISKSLDLTAPFGIRELFDHPERGLDDMLVRKMLVQYRGHLSVVAAPSELRLLPTIRPEIIRDLVNILRAQFDFVIMDVPHVWTDWTAAALTYSDHTIMVGQLWLRSLTHASRLFSAWHTVGVQRDAISLIINRSGAKFKEAITAQDFERICHHKIDDYISNDVKAVAHAENHAQTIFEIGQASPVQQQVRDLAQRMMTRFAPNAIRHIEHAIARPKKGLLNMGKK